MLVDRRPSLLRPIALALCGMPALALANSPAPALTAQAARAAIAQVLAAPGIDNSGHVAAVLASLAFTCASAALCLMWRARGAKPSGQYPLPVYTPLSPAPMHVVDEAERLWPESPQAALGLLYQGLLNRLVRDYHLDVPLGATEPEVVAKVASLRLGGLEDFTRRLVTHWEQVAYARQPLDDSAWAHLVASWRRLFPDDVTP